MRAPLRARGFEPEEEPLVATGAELVGAGRMVVTVPTGAVAVPVGLLPAATVLGLPDEPPLVGGGPLGRVRVRDVSCTPGTPAWLQVFSNSVGGSPDQRREAVRGRGKCVR